MTSLSFTRVLAALALFSICHMELQAKELKILGFGNSYSHGYLDFLPGLAEANGDKAEVMVLRGSPNLFTYAIEKEQTGEPLISPEEAKKLPPPKAAKEGYVQLESGYENRVPVLSTIKSRKWDVVVFQCHSSQANNPNSWKKDLQFVYDTVKKECPDAEFWIYLTTQYRNDGLLYGTEVNKAVYGAASKDVPYNEDLHYLDAYQATYALAEEIGCKIVPGSTAFEIARYHPEWGINLPDPEFNYETPEAPAQPPRNNSLRIGFRYTPNKKSPLNWRLDSHPTSVGNYLVGGVYCEKLFGKSPVGNTYLGADKKVEEKDAKILQKIAHEAVQGHMPPLRLHSVEDQNRYGDILLEKAKKAEASDPDLAAHLYGLIVSCAPQHSAVADAKAFLEKQGKKPEYPSVDSPEVQKVMKRQAEIWEKFASQLLKK